MKGSSITALAATFSLASSAAIKSGLAPVPDKEILEAMLENPVLLPKRLHNILHDRVSGLAKRQAPVPGAPGGKGLDFGALIAGLSGGNLANAPKTNIPEIQEEQPKGWKQAKRVKIRYGPYRIPAISEKNFQSEVLKVQGMSDTFKIGAKKPCDDHCTILSLEADLEFADGSPATNTKGAWFHHAVLLNSGPTVVEPNCGSEKIRVENIFMSGNERSTGGFSLPNSTIKSGYTLAKEDKFILQAELMNLKDQEQFVWMTITYEYLPGAQPDYLQGKTVWLSIGFPVAGFCSKVKSPWGPSNLTLTQLPKSKKFSEHSTIWSAPRDGYLLSTGGHMHDGGVDMKIYHNYKSICTSTPKYVKDGHSHGMGGMKKRQVPAGNYNNNDIAHIEKQTGCAFFDGYPLKRNDTMYTEANYDFDKIPGMKNKDGNLDEVMGIVGSLVALKA